jgi:serine/threonine protein kinase
MSAIKETLDAKLTEVGGKRRLNQYILQKQLGSGSFGVVYLGEDTELKRKVAIKEYSKSKLRKQKLNSSGGFGGVRGRGRGRGGSIRRVTVSR